MSDSAVYISLPFNHNKIHLLKWHEHIWKHNKKHGISYSLTTWTKKYIIKGISPANPPWKLQSELEDSGYKVHSVTNLVSWATKNVLPMFQFILTIDPMDKDIEGIKQPGLLRVKIEQFKRKRKSLLCSNWQWAKHTAGHCQAPLKCRDCSGNHKTQDCTTQSNKHPHANERMHSVHSENRTQINPNNCTPTQKPTTTSSQTIWTTSNWPTFSVSTSTYTKTRQKQCQILKSYSISIRTQTDVSIEAEIDTNIIQSRPKQVSQATQIPATKTTKKS